MKQIGSEYIPSPATLDTSGRGAPSEFPALELRGDQQAQHVDVLIVGAGLSGIGAACYLKAHCPTKSFAILEQRNAIGATSGRESVRSPNPYGMAVNGCVTLRHGHW